MGDYAFVAGGRLHVSRDGGAPRALESAFADSVRDRAQDIHRRHAWKGEASQGGFGAMAWGRQAGPPPAVHSRVTGLTRGSSPGQVLYTIDVDRLTAICASDPETGRERRLLHGSQTRIRDLCARPDRQEIACAVVHDDGTASIALMSGEATDLRQVTEGSRWTLPPPGPTTGRRASSTRRRAWAGMRRGGRPASAGSRSTCWTCSAGKWRRWPRTRARTWNARGSGRTARSTT